MVDVGSLSNAGKREPTSTTRRRFDATIKLRGVLGLPVQAPPVPVTIKHRSAAHRFPETDAPLLSSLPQLGLVDAVLDRITSSVQGPE